MNPRTISRLLIFALLLLSLTGASWIQPDPAAAKSAEYARFDMHLTVLDNGTFRIVETQTVDFTDGPFRKGYRSIPLARITGVEHIAVSEEVDGVVVPYEYSREENDDTYMILSSSTEVIIRWTFMPTIEGTRTFIVEYDLVGALRYYPNATPPNQQVWFLPIGGPLTAETPVNASTFTLHYPRPIDPASILLSIDGEVVTDLEPFTTDYQRFVFEHDGFTRGEAWEIRLQSEVVAVDAEVQPWQTDDDERRAATPESD